MQRVMKSGYVEFEIRIGRKKYFSGRILDRPKRNKIEIQTACPYALFHLRILAIAGNTGQFCFQIVVFIPGSNGDTKIQILGCAQGFVHPVNMFEQKIARHRPA